MEPQRELKLVPYMNVPEEFVKFTEMFHQDSWEKGWSPQQWIDSRIKLFSPELLKAVRIYIAGLLAVKNGEQLMEAAWLSSGVAAYGVKPGEWRVFFALLLDRLEKAR